MRKNFASVLVNLAHPRDFVALPTPCQLEAADAGEQST
jgi:hypothetical protein